MAVSNDHFVLICSTRKGTVPVLAIQDRLADNLPEGFSIRIVDCMAGCAHPRTVGFQAVGKAQYLFGDIETDRDIAALVQFAQQYHDSEDGWTSATDRPAALYHKTLSRMPRIEQEAQQ